MSVISMKQLLEAGVHFGHQTRRWNPKMAKFIFTERNGIYIIDLQKTVKKVEEAYRFTKEIAETGKPILFVGTKKQAQEAIKEEAIEEVKEDIKNLEIKDEIEEAKAYFERILILKPHQVDTMVELGLCEAASYNLEKAIEHFSTAAKIKEDPEILCNLGMAYLNNGELDEAIYYVERAYELNPEDEITVACMRELDNYR